MRNELLSAKRSTWLLALVPVVTLAACNTVTTGDAGALTFTPSECGKSGCSLDDALLVGGTTKITLESATDHATVFDLTLISSDPNVLQIDPAQAGSFSSEWTMVGVGAGNVDLVAIDGNGFEVDRTPVDVRFADRLDIVRDTVTSVQLAPRPGFDQVWRVQAGTVADLKIFPFLGGDKMMGKFQYNVDIDAVLLAGVIPSADITRGELVFQVRAGQYPVTFTAADGTRLRLLIVAQ